MKEQHEKAVHVKEYSRSRHGRAGHGGRVRAHSRLVLGDQEQAGASTLSKEQATKEFGRIVRQVECEQGEFDKIPKLIIKPWAGTATNHIRQIETPQHTWKTTNASVVIDTGVLRDPKLSKFLAYHELRENNISQTQTGNRLKHPPEYIIRRCHSQVRIQRGGIRTDKLKDEVGRRIAHYSNGGIHR